MYCPPYRRRHRLRNALFKLFAFGLLCGALWGGVVLFRRTRFDADRINAETFLKAKTFDKTVREEETPTGLPFWLLEDHETPIVALSFLFENAGSAYEPEDKQGLTGLAASLLPLGAGAYDRTALSDLLELNGIHLAFSSDRDDFGGSLVVPTKNIDKAVEILKLVLTEPLLDENELDLLRLQAVESLKLKAERPERRLQNAVRKAVYGNHPYARDPDGTPEGLSRVSAEDIRSFLNKKLTQNKLLIGLAGDVTVSDAKALVDRLFASIPQSAEIIELTPPRPDVSADKPVKIPYDSAQILTAFVAHGTTRQASDFYPLYVANYIFGGSGLTSRLSLQAREKEGLTYGVSTSLNANEQAPLLMGSFATTPENYARMMQIVRDEWQKMARDGVSQEEFDSAINYLLASYNLRFNSTDGLADMLVYMQKYRLGADFLLKRNDMIRALTPEEVNAAARKYFAVLPREIGLGKLTDSEEN